MKEADWKVLRKEYLRHIRLERGLSDNSAQAYGHDVHLLEEFLRAQYTLFPPQAEPHHIEAFMAALYDQGKTRTSQARTLSGIKSLYGFLQHTDAIDVDPTELIEGPKSVRRLPETLTVEEIDCILSSIDLSGPHGERNRALLEMLYSCGLRVSEVVSLRLSDLFFDEGYVRVTGKGDKQRLVPLSDEARMRVERWLRLRSGVETSVAGRETVFLNNRGGPLSRIMVFHIIRRSALQAGIRKHVSPHTFRHSFATHLLAGGANIRQIQEMLGHESILTTEIYTHLDRSQLRRSVEEHHPLSSDT